MKLLVVNDPHVSDRPPACRTNSYRDDILNKLRETVEIAGDINAVKKGKASKRITRRVAGKTTAM